MRPIAMTGNVDPGGERVGAVGVQGAGGDLRVGDGVDLVLLDRVEEGAGFDPADHVGLDVLLEPLLEDPPRDLARAEAGDLHFTRQPPVGVVELLRDECRIDLDGEPALDGRNLLDQDLHFTSSLCSKLSCEA